MTTRLLMFGRMRRLLLISCLSVCVSVLSLLAADRAQACSCMQPPSPVEAARDASVVFHGKLVSVRDAPKTGGPHALAYKIFTFEVVRTFKGQLDAQVNVHTADNSAACGRSYGDPGSEWLVYARVDDNGQTNDSACSRTRALADASEDIAALAGGDLEQTDEPPPVEPGPAEPEPAPVLPQEQAGPEPTEPSKKGCAITDLDGGGGLAGLALLGLVAAHRRRRG
jgi:MYXO-CTERM domain-containing protein